MCRGQPYNLQSSSNTALLFPSEERTKFVLQEEEKVNLSSMLIPSYKKEESCDSLESTSTSSSVSSAKSQPQPKNFEISVVNGDEEEVQEQKEEEASSSITNVVLDTVTDFLIYTLPTKIPIINQFYYPDC